MKTVFVLMVFLASVAFNNPSSCNLSKGVKSSLCSHSFIDSIETSDLEVEKSLGDVEIQHKSKIYLIEIESSQFLSFNSFYRVNHLIFRSGISPPHFLV